MKYIEELIHNMKQKESSHTEYFILALKEIQPSQLWISKAKLEVVKKKMDSKNINNNFPILPVQKIDGKFFFTDGHTRAFYAYLNNMEYIKVYLDPDRISIENYRTCIEWARKEGISWIGDLKNRVIYHREYKEKWLDRCKNEFGQ